MKLESLKEFQANSLNQAEMNSVLGGKEPKWKRSEEEKVDENGCKLKLMDTYYDKNDNNTIDENESVSYCVTKTCD